MTDDELNYELRVIQVKELQKEIIWLREVLTDVMLAAESGASQEVIAHTAGRALFAKYR